MVMENQEMVMENQEMVMENQEMVMEKSWKDILSGLWEPCYS